MMKEYFHGMEYETLTHFSGKTRSRRDIHRGPRLGQVTPTFISSVKT